MVTLLFSLHPRGMHNWRCATHAVTPKIKEHWGTTPLSQKSEIRLWNCDEATRTAVVYSAWHSTRDSAESFFQNTGESWLLPCLKNWTLLITTCNKVKIIHFIQKITNFYPQLPGSYDRFHSSPLWSSFQAVVLLLNCNTEDFLCGLTAINNCLLKVLQPKPASCPLYSCKDLRVALCC